MARTNLRRTSVLAATAASAGVGIILTAMPASADVYSNIRQCESGGNYSTNTGNGYFGAYQFSQQTWNGLGYSGVPSSASPATAASAGVGIILTAMPASADVYSNIRQCESGGNYSTNTGNGYFGAYQFSQQTWNGLGYSGVPSSASPATQDAAAAQLAARSGFGQWPVCGAGGGSAAPVPAYTSYAPASRDFSRSALPAPAVPQPAAPQPTPTYTSYAPASRDFSRSALPAPAAPQPATVSNIYGFFSTANVNQVRDDVRRFQKAMNARGSNLVVDGQYGPQTEKAATNFQQANNLLVDGIVGPQTWSAAGLK